MKKKIAIDLDGVVFDSENLYRVYTEIYDIEVKGGNHLVDNSKRLFQQRYDWTEEEFQNFYLKNAETVLTTANLMTGVEIVLPKLCEVYDVVIVTSRSDIEVTYAKNKLKEVGLAGVKLYNNEHHKIERFKEENVTYIIDDDENICKNAAMSGFKAIYFKNAASSKLEENNIVNVNNWGEVYKYLMLEEN